MGRYNFFKSTQNGANNKMVTLLYRFVILFQTNALLFFCPFKVGIHGVYKYIYFLTELEIEIKCFRAFSIKPGHYTVSQINPIESAQF